MEGQTQFQTALKKTVVMFKTLTGKELTEEEGSIFINLLDMTEGYLTPGVAQVAIADQWPAVGVELAKSHAPMARDADADPRHNLIAQSSGASATICNAVGAESGQHEATLIDAARDEPYVASTIRTSKRDHIQGYDWQIVVLSREKDASDSYVVHFAHLPTTEQFEEHYSKFVARTHYVHVNEWHRGEREWVGITTRYAAGVTQPLKQDHDPRWEQADMAYRVRYYDRETGQLTFKYMPRKPSGNELATYHHLKGFAVVQSKVA